MSIRDAPGPEHAPTFSHDCGINGVVLGTAPHVVYEQGVLTELYRPEWVGVFGADEPVEHLYTVYSPDGGVTQRILFPRAHPGPVHADARAIGHRPLRPTAKLL